MQRDRRATGIEAIPEVPWGTHICHLYSNRKDLLNILVPYFKTGLENNELCVWVTSKPLLSDDAILSLKKTVDSLDYYSNKGQLEVMDADRWYRTSGKLDCGSALIDLVEKAKFSFTKGFDGLRIAGNCSWIKRKEWEAFKVYEASVDNISKEYNVIAICSYQQERLSALEMINLVDNHQYVLVKKISNWGLLGV
jgi:hypothetical protein